MCIKETDQFCHFIFLFLLLPGQAAPHVLSLSRSFLYIRGLTSEYLNRILMAGKDYIRHVITLYYFFFSAVPFKRLIGCLCLCFIVSSSYTDMPIFGQCPAQDDFYLVMCSQCSQVVKPQAFQAHYGTFHTLDFFTLTP